MKSLAAIPEETASVAGSNSSGWLLASLIEALRVFFTDRLS